MNIIRKLGISLLQHIDDKLSAEKIQKLIYDYNDNKRQIDEYIDKQRNIYVAQYENARIENDVKYDAYLLERAEIYNAWKKNGNKGTLMELLSISKPNMKSIPEIYTYTVIDPNPKERKKQEVPLKPKKAITKAPKEKKDCPEGQIRNPATGRCIADPALKKPKEQKEAGPKVPKAPKEKKDCPEGQIRNPATGRCIADPALKKPKKVHNT